MEKPTTKEFVPAILPLRRPSQDKQTSGDGVMIRFTRDKNGPKSR